MTKLEIVTIPDRILRTKSVPIERIDAETLRFLDSMLETMYAAPGIGLAAVQVGLPRRMLTIDVTPKDEDGRNPMLFINPEIVWRSDARSTYEEGCLSIPEYYAEVERPAEVKVRYLDPEGQTQEIDAAGVLATCLQHEIDHLDGKLFIDHISKLKRDMVVKKFAKAAKAKAL